MRISLVYLRGNIYLLHIGYIASHTWAGRKTYEDQIKEGLNDQNVTIACWHSFNP